VRAGDTSRKEEKKTDATFSCSAMDAPRGEDQARAGTPERALADEGGRGSRRIEPMFFGQPFSDKCRGEKT